MNEHQNTPDFKEIAAQLRKPTDDMGREVAVKMNNNNAFINQKTIEEMKLTVNDKILEIGMGNGYFCKDILSTDNSIHYTACDFSKTMVEEATALNKEAVSLGRASFHLASADNLPLPDNSFTKIFTVNTIYFWEDPLSVLTEFERVLVPGGKVYIAIRSKESMVSLPFVQYGFNLFNEENLRSTLSKIFPTVHTRTYIEPQRDIQGEMIQLESIIAVGQKD